MSINIEDADIDLIVDVHKEYFKIVPTVYTPFAPVPFRNDLATGRYLKIDPRKKDNKCYVKIKEKNLWLYKNDDKIELKPLHCIKNGFDYAHPIKVWIEYLREPTFMLYLPTGYGEPVIRYIRYEKFNNKLKLYIVKDVFYATTFSYDHTKWHSNLALSKDLTSGR